LCGVSEHFDRTGTIGDIRGGDVDGMRESIGIHGDMTLDPGHLLSPVVSLEMCGVGVLHALRVNDPHARGGFPAIAYTLLLDQFFLRPPQGWSLGLRQMSRSIF
jgi:hypothetical protein